jgi:tRNA pseudouridine38-40 synthase
MPTFRITLAYDGTDFVGWQRQATGVSIQGLLEDALGELDGRPVTVIGAGRTDAGVHALGQVASFSLDKSMAPDTVVRALNARLPVSVRVVAAAEAPGTFHARFGARMKTYRYRMWHGDVINPFERQYAWHLTGTLDVDRMAEAARVIEGRHDFAAFQAAGGTARTSEREVLSSCVDAQTGQVGQVGQVGRLVVYEVCGNGFLRHMVRNIVGTLVEIGRGRRPPGWIGEVLASRVREQAGPTAPAAGLFLVNVTYDAGAVAAES